MHKNRSWQKTSTHTVNVIICSTTSDIHRILQCRAFKNNDTRAWCWDQKHEYRTVSYPSTASRRNHRKLSKGCTNGGPFSIDGCFCVYVVNTTNALVLFFRQRNLQSRQDSEIYIMIEKQNKKKNQEWTYIYWISYWLWQAQKHLLQV